MRRRGRRSGNCGTLCLRGQRWKTYMEQAKGWMLQALWQSVFPGIPEAKTVELGVSDVGG